MSKKCLNWKCQEVLERKSIYGLCPSCLLAHKIGVASGMFVSFVAGMVWAWLKG